METSLEFFYGGRFCLRNTREATHYALLALNLKQRKSNGKSKEGMGDKHFIEALPMCILLGAVGVEKRNSTHLPGFL